ncbi:unnamed protein product, partial [Choristocarpus tenellus]
MVSPSNWTSFPQVSNPESSEEDQPDSENLRTTCDGCTASKVKCDGGQPCKRCARRRSPCVYREKRRCGPKRRRPTKENEEEEDKGVLWVSLSDNRLRARILSSSERDYLGTYCRSVNKFITITTMTVIRDAMNPLPMDFLDEGITLSEEERHTFYARKAVLLGCVAIGAVYCGDDEAGSIYMDQAHMYLKDCFDALLPEVVSCYLVMVLFHLHCLDRPKVFRYIGFAQQAFKEMSPSQQDGAGEVSDSVMMLSTFLHVACDSDIRVEEIEVDGGDLKVVCARSISSRMLSIFSYVLLALFRRTDAAGAAKAPLKAMPLPSLVTLGSMMEESHQLLEMMENPGALSIIVIKTLRGYFLLMNTGTDKKVMEEVAMPVSKALESDQGVLHFPLCWHMCSCISAFLKRMNQSTAAEAMDTHMEPLRPNLSFAGCCCSVALDIFSVYAGDSNISRMPNNGLFSTPGLRGVAQRIASARLANSKSLSSTVTASGRKGADIGPDLDQWASSTHPAADTGPATGFDGESGADPVPTSNSMLRREERVLPCTQLATETSAEMLTGTESISATAPSGQDCEQGQGAMTVGQGVLSIRQAPPPSSQLTQYPDAVLGVRHRGRETQNGGKYVICSGGAVGEADVVTREAPGAIVVARQPQGVARRGAGAGVAVSSSIVGSMGVEGQNTIGPLSVTGRVMPNVGGEVGWGGLGGGLGGRTDAMSGEAHRQGEAV